MSYILDALRKADAERARGALPTLQTPPGVPQGPVRVAGAVRVRRGGWLLAVALLLGASAAAVWWWPAPPAVVAPSAAAPRSLQPAPGEPPAPASALEAAPPPAARIVLPELPPAPRPAAPAPPAAPAAQAAPAASATASARIPRLEELPASTRRQLPALKIGGSVYSDQPASRFVMIDGQLLHEGERVAPGLVLERIGARSAVLRLGEQRFELAY